jgi:hypothetical protein
VEDLKNALGQYILYEKIIKKQSLDQVFYLAIRDAIHRKLFMEEISGILLGDWVLWKPEILLEITF